ncbi:hypothetical protein TD95_005038 [Thielaviopsis punctulata]|uniref:Probable aspartic-type endopeptidase OPSB n=1 Tax=Thielaviopsis punctulata TaxID=72032 RepID=A0A0F4ZKI2_9PEZI|nr:hypothetical protein TD95_005038 [Thielaviopsis punctulata]
MLFRTFLAAAVVGVSAAPTTESIAQPRVVSLDMQRSKVTDPIKRDRLRRRGTVQESIDNLQTLYFANGSVGTPAQNVRMHLDTGSSDLWINFNGSTLCQSSDDPCAQSGTYNPNASSTYTYIGSYFNISYVDGSGASGDYVTDTFNIGGSTVKDFQFGVGYKSTSDQAILGIGYPLNEVQVGRAGLKPYANLPLKMVDSGLISAQAYSLYLNDLDASTGTVLFGGVDSDKYTGDLYTVPIQSQYNGVYAEFLITLTGVSMGSTTLGSNMAQAVLLDSGSSLSYLPNDMVNTIYDKVNAYYSENEQVAFVPCTMANNKNLNFTFTFSKPEIVVPMDEMVLSVQDVDGNDITFNNGEKACLFGIAPAGDSTVVLGDTFLRSSYLVYNLDRNEISLAQTKFNVTSSNVKEIPGNNGTVPGATAVSNPVLATAGVVQGGQEINGEKSTSDSDKDKSSSAGLVVPMSFGASLVSAVSAVVVASLMA